MRQLVSVVLPTHNGVKSLMECSLPSIREQSHKNLEIIVVADNCTDDTVARVKALGDSRIQVVECPGVNPATMLSQDKYNLVCSAYPRNVGLSRVHGEWIAGAGDDDAFSPTHIDDLLRYAIVSRCDFVYAKADWTAKTEGGIRGKWPFAFGNVVIATVLYSHRFGDMRHDERSYLKPVVDDWDMWQRMKARGARVGFLDKVVTYSNDEGRDARWAERLESL